MTSGPQSPAEQPSVARLVGGFVLLCLIWGSTWLAIKEGLATVPPFLSAAVRFAVAIILLVVVMLHRKLYLPRDKAYYRLIVETGILIYALPFALIYWGQSLIPSGLSAVLFATFPFFVAIAGRLRLPGERLTGPRIAGIVLGFAGVYVVFSSELDFNRNISPLGMAAIVVSAAMQAYALISVRLRGREVSPVSLTLGGMVIGGLFLTVVSAVLEYGSQPVFDTRAIVSILYLAIFGTVITFLTYFWLVKHINPVLLALTAFITPIVALTLGVLVRGEHFGPQLLVGAMLVLSGVLLANFTGLLTLLGIKEK